MKKTMITTARQHFNHLTCTLFVVLGLLGLTASASQAATGAFSFSAANYAVGEGAGTVKITINRVGGSTGSATVAWKTQGVTATFAQDYGNFDWTTLTFAAGVTQQVKYIKIVNDTRPEPAETFKVLLASPTSGTTLGSINSAVVTIKANDDLAAPTVSLTSPRTATTLTAAQTVTLAANAADDVGVTKVLFYDGATLKGTDTTAPYTFAWPISSANNGRHSLTAKAYDAFGRSKVSAAVLVTISIGVPVTDLIAPLVSITNPASGMSYSSAQNVSVTATASDNIGVTKVELYDGAILMGADVTAPYVFSLGVTAASNGIHSLTAKAYDAAGNKKVSAASVIAVNIPAADLIAPTVALTSPASATAFTTAQTVTIAASASDNIGVSKVEFYDGATLKGTDTTAPFSFAWAISSTNNGSHSLTAKAYDAVGNSKVSTTAVVTVNIQAPVVSGLLKAFPGAEGYGTKTVAGRRGQIIKVTNLNDSGAGSLRAAVATAGARIIVFEVGGHIKLSSDLTVSQPFVTIAGQSAPFPGIQISGGRITIQTHDVLIQHLRARYGDYSGTNASHSMRIVSGSYNVVVDHCTFMWADDEVASIWTNSQPIHDITLSNSIVAEGLGSHGYGTILGAFYSPSPGANWVDKISLIKNLYAHNYERSPSLSRDVNAVVINNLSYNAQWEFMALGLNNGPTTASIIGNQFITGSSNYGGAAIGIAAGGVGSRIYQADNKVSGLYSRSVFSDGTGRSVVSQPPLADDTTILPVASVKDYVLRNVGAWPAFRDSAETRVVNEVRNGTGFHKNSIAEAGGWPTAYNNMKSRSLAALLPANPNADDDGDGYTNVEEVLSSMAAEVEGRAAL